jgi:protein CWC15
MGLERGSSSSSGGGGGIPAVKRRWNDDVVFKNQAKDEPEVKKRFINDTVRSDFHRSFMKKYIK